MANTDKYLNSTVTACVLQQLSNTFIDFADEIDAELLQNNQLSEDKLLFTLLEPVSLDGECILTLLRKIVEAILSEEALHNEFYAEDFEYFSKMKTRPDQLSLDFEPDDIL